MAERLLLRLQSDHEFRWLNQAEDGRALAGSSAGLPSAQVLAAARQIVVLVPSAQILLTETATVTRQRNQLARAIPYALEDQLASPVEDLHFALPEHIAGAQIAVAVVARNVLQGWIDLLATHGIRADALVPDALALSATTGTLLIESQQSLLRIGAQRALSCDTASLAEWLPVIAADTSPTIALEVFDFRAAPALDLGVPIANYHAQQRDPLRLLAQGLGATLPLNLLQGSYAARHRQAPVQKLWRWAAILAVATVVLAFAHALIVQWRLQREANAIDLAQRVLLHETFPALTRDDDPPGLMHSELNRLRGGAEVGGLLRLLSQIAPVLGSTTRITTKGVEFRNDTLEISLRTPDVPMLDSLRERLATQPGLKVEVTAANPNEAGVDGRLRISGAKP